MVAAHEPAASSGPDRLCYTVQMTVLEKFISFAQGLSADRRQSVESALAALMESYSDNYEFTGDELAEIDRRTANSTPELSDPDEITRLFGKPFSA